MLIIALYTSNLILALILCVLLSQYFIQNRMIDKLELQIKTLEEIINKNKNIPDSKNVENLEHFIDPLTLKIIIFTTIISLGVIYLLFSSNAAKAIVEEYPNIMKETESIIGKTGQTTTEEILKNVEPKLDIAISQSIITSNQCQEILDSMDKTIHALIDPYILEQISNGG